MLRYSCLLLLLLGAVSAFAQQFDPVSCYGGRTEFMRFLKEEMVYPPAALEAGTQGTVIVFCVVTANGTTRDARIFKGISPELNKEALRIFDRVLWEPAIQDGANKASEVLLHIPFRIARYKRWCRRRGYVEPHFPHQPVSAEVRVLAVKDTDTPPKPELPEGLYSLSSYMASKVQYPPAAVKHNIEGTAKVSFVVEPSGNVSNLHAVHYLGGGCTEEVLRIIRSVNWQPGIRNNEAVRTQIRFSFRFKLPDSHSTKYGSAAPQHSIN